ncbi:SDR family oxidoreductase [Lachnospiraceae bacterium PAL113]|uniref:SDR family oxidoreductase n=2 Tax=Aequitasia blattaphilus TaxID=2949332 RepID=A0ABT1E9H3_9FIRM|nr:SDR family NAD(P)-dependent oxidoreductase [Aequitasia blattaphilus]MCP1101642.1 SDR family oxidoreductase [Aequitasia blattaphilus]MCR8614282.1 SDR family oxidoreductase [Aequitasia blattaphilus]
MYDLKGKVAVITGASSGLGADAARGYAKEGANVALLARRVEKLEALAEELKAFNVDVFIHSCDVTDEESVKTAMEAVHSHFKRVDILLNNAGIAVRGGVHDMSVEDWDKSLNTNLKGIFLSSKYVIPYMMEQEYGKIVNIASINAVIADKQDVFIRHSYNASKSGVLGITKGMAASYGKYNITVNAVGPGLFESEMTENTLFKSSDFLNGYNYQCPMGRPGKRGELNGVILFFSSEMSSYVSGQFVIVDGGTSIV